MSKKKGITTSTVLGGPSSTLGGSALGGSIYIGNAINQPVTISATGATAGAVLTTTGYVNYSYQKSPADDMYEKDGNLFWRNSKGEVFKLTFTKQETVKQIIDDL